MFIKLVSYKDLIKKSRIELTLRVLFSIGSLLIVVYAIAAPLIQHYNGYPVGENIYSALSNACHQYPTRSFWIFDRPFALCARCTSAYLGIFIFSTFLTIKQSYIKRLLIGLALVLVISADPVIQLFSSYESTNFMRFLTGILGGMGTFLMLNFFPLNHKD